MLHVLSHVLSQANRPVLKATSVLLEIHEKRKVKQGSSFAHYDFGTSPTTWVKLGWKGEEECSFFTLLMVKLHTRKSLHTSKDKAAYST